VSSSRILAFGPFELDPVRRILRRDAEAVALAGKPMELLLVLLEHRDRVVEREELLSTVWRDLVVEEANLTQTVSVLRRVLGEGAGENAYIVTVPGRGYRFVAEVRAAGERPDSGPPRPARRWSHPVVLVLAALTVAVLALSILPGWRERPSPPADTGAMAVLPLLAGDLGQPADSLGLGLADALITRLAAAGVAVRPTRMVVEFSDPRRDTPQEAARQLGVPRVLTGTVREAGGRVRLSLQLVAGADGATIWADVVELDGSLAADEDRLLDLAAEKVLAALGRLPAPGGAAPGRG
jgi:DNA-binding winged helix-turn-helix (wHTH) protein/TolB-like protein